MAKKSTIEWCDSTFNPWIGCTKISPGCDHCYAERQMDQRLGRVRWGAGQPRQRTSAAYWRQPERWNGQPLAECAVCGLRSENPLMAQCRGPGRSQHLWQPARRRVFCASLADVFDTEVPVGWLMDLLDLIRRTPNLDWLLLTKRIGNVIPRLGAVAGLAGSLGEEGDKAASETWGMAFDWARFIPPENVWLGATVVNQTEADRDIPKLLATPAAKRFVSIEPMLGPIDLYNGDPDPRLGGIEASQTFIGEWWEPGDAPSQPPRHGLDWVIAGGESGPGARPMHPDWVRSLRDQCQAAGVPFLFKQWGAWAPASDECTRREGLRRVGKHGAGRLLDGREWLEFPA